MKKGFTLVEMLACQPEALRRQARAAFTLVEMLVVIAILAILMAMMVPAAGMILRRAANARARADADIVVATMMKYRMEYNRWPTLVSVGKTPDGQDIYLTDQAWFDIMSPDPEDPRTTDNFNQIIFFEPGGGALQDDPAEDYYGGFVDSWGNPYKFSLDSRGSEEFTNPDPDRDTDEPLTLRGKVVAWSAGVDRLLDGTSAEAWEDNIKSWWK